LAATIQKFVNKYIWNTEQRGVNVTGISGGWKEFYNYLFLGLSSDSESGETVTVEKGSRIDVAFSCINALAQDIAKLPFNVRQDTDKGKVIIKNEVYRLIHSRPNTYTSAYNFWYNIVFNMLAWGNGYAFIKKDPKELIILPPSEVDCLVIEGEIFYKYKEAIIPQADMLHYKLYSFDGIVGVSPIVHNANTFGYRLKQEKYSAKVLGSKPPGFLSSDQPLSITQQQENAKEWKSRTTGDNLGSTPVLAGGMKYNALMIPPNEGQMIEAAELTDERITGIYRVPPTIIQNYRRATFSNAEQQDLVYSKYAITPIVRVIEQETDYKLIGDQTSNPPYTKFNIKAMLQGDTRTQTEYYKFLRSFGIASANTILELEDMPPLENDGDMVVIQGAFVPIDQLREFYKPAKGVGDDLRNKQIGFDLQTIKQHIERLEIQNSSE
jgi:HK97 family phage portal protein